MADLINQNNKHSHSGAIAGFLGIAAAFGLTAGTLVVVAQSGQDITQDIYRTPQFSQQGTKPMSDPFGDYAWDLPSNDISFYDPLEARFGEFARVNEITIQVKQDSSVWQELNYIVVQDATRDETLADSERLTGNLVEALGEQNPGLNLDEVQPCDRFVVIIRPVVHTPAIEQPYSSPYAYPTPLICDPYVVECVPSTQQSYTDEQGLPLYPTQGGTEVPSGMHAPLGSVTEPSTGTPNPNYDGREHSSNGTAQNELLPDN
jgi:hypothetical protein